jgi:AGCS family alanine or glycine:cation symporter
MESTLADLAGQLYGIVWNVVMPVLLLGTGVYLTVGLKLMPVRTLKSGFSDTLQQKINAAYRSK